MAKADKQMQAQRFIETARALGCDEDKERFEAALGKIAQHKPTPKDHEPSKKRTRAKSLKNAQ
ncbi:MAG TPA: hypothetical protein VL996_07390 [Methylocella sp.]|nr:hypothetical protein [Methylocella sp.]